ncbi:uncharacterized protein LOC135218099 [Macrobrachium nipponense]|uniref:uncharacterized protein LOC135218099 n=1 Tax=Macrobrachium nipponense TaxID=159736 RepID=UPI0030C89071
MNRQWKWPLPPGKVLIMTITYFNLGPCCACAYLEVLNLVSGALIKGPYCGALAVPFTITIPTRNVEVHLFSDGTQILDGFEFSYESIEAFVCESPVTSLTNATGEIVARKVLNMPMTCMWRITLPAGMMIKMTFTEFNLNACCGCAYLRVIDTEFTPIALTGLLVTTPSPQGLIPLTISSGCQSDKRGLATPKETKTAITSMTAQQEEVPEDCWASTQANNYTSLENGPQIGRDHCGTTIPSPIPATISNQIEITLYTNGAASLPGLVIQYEECLQPVRKLNSPMRVDSDPQ